jgi:outer membrane protein TolC
VLAIGVAVLQPIFNGGALNAEIAGATARQQAAVAAYGSAALNAFRQVETALANEGYYRQRLGLIREQSKNYTQAVDLAVDKYNAGTISLQNLLQLQSDLLASDSAVIDATSGLLTNRVDLYLALGGTP